MPRTVQAPHLSNFISSMLRDGLIEMPPVSKVTPLPTSATISSPLPHSSRTSLGGLWDPLPTARIPPIPRASRSATSRTSQSMLHCDASARACSAIQSGVASLGGVFARSRLSFTARASGWASFRAARKIAVSDSGGHRYTVRSAGRLSGRLNRSNRYPEPSSWHRIRSAARPSVTGCRGRTTPIARRPSARAWSVTRASQRFNRCEVKAVRLPSPCTSTSTVRPASSMIARVTWFSSAFHPGRELASAMAAPIRSASGPASGIDLSKQATAMASHSMRSPETSLTVGDSIGVIPPRQLRRSVIVAMVQAMPSPDTKRPCAVAPGTMTVPAGIPK